MPARRTRPGLGRVKHPYQDLTPDVVLDALSALGLPVDGRISALSSYENRVYQVMLDDAASVVVKIYRPERWTDAQIQEEHAFTAEMVADEIPVVGPLCFNGQSLHTLHTQGEGGPQRFVFSVCPRRGGRRPELDDPEVLNWIGRFLARIHQVGARSAFKARPTLDVDTFGWASLHWLQAQEAIAVEVAATWLSVCREALTLAQAALASVPFTPLRLHGDCHPGNILWTPVEQPEGGPHFVDLDDARMGPAVQDLWMLLSGDRRDRSWQLSEVLAGYESLRPFDTRELALIEPLRTLRLVHYSAWLARRQDDPAFAQHFAWFGSVSYWQDQVSILREQIEAMQEPPLQV